MHRRSLRARLEAIAWRLHYEAFYRLALLWRRVVSKTDFVAVAGSRGKTTCKNLIAAALSTQGPTVATPGNDNGLLGVPRTVMRVRPRTRFAVVEAGTDGPGIMRRWSRLLRPRVAVLLAVSQAHRKEFATLAATAAEKAHVFDCLQHDGYAVINADDEKVAGVSAKLSASVVRVGIGADCDPRIVAAVSSWPERLRVTLAVDGRDLEVRTSLVGTHWATAVAAAIAVARALGIGPEAAARGIAAVLPEEGRMQPVLLPNGAIVIRDEYQGGEDTYAPAFELMSQARVPGRRILIVGDPTDSRDDTSKRIRRIARAGAHACDLLIFFGEHSRHAIAAVAAAGLEPERVRAYATIEEAAAFVREETRRGDLLLLKGRTNDHITRVLFAASGRIECSLPSCRKMILCDHCEELGYSSPLPRAASGSRARSAWTVLTPECRGGVENDAL